MGGIVLDLGNNVVYDSGVEGFVRYMGIYVV